MVKDIEKKVNSALSQTTSNSKLIAKNLERTPSQLFDYHSLVERIETLKIKNKELTDELE